MASAVGVLGGSGGVGASTFSAALARAAGRCVLIDCDPDGGGLDVLLGVEAVPGARWSGLRLDGGRLDPQLLADGLPRWGEVGLLAADAPVEASAIGQVIAAAAELGPVILDLPRVSGRTRSAAMRLCRLVVLVASSRVAGLAAARAVLPTDVPVGVVLRRPPRNAPAVLPRDAARLLGVPLLGVLPPLDGSDAGADVPRATQRIASGVLRGLAMAPSAEAVA